MVINLKMPRHTETILREIVRERAHHERNMSDLVEHHQERMKKLEDELRIVTHPELLNQLKDRDGCAINEGDAVKILTSGKIGKEGDEGVVHSIHNVQVKVKLNSNDKIIRREARHVLKY
mgnify:FL=1